MRNPALAALAIALLLPPVADAQTFAGKPFLSVQGHAEAKVRPDIFPLKVTLSEISMDPAKSQSLIEGLAKRALAAAARQKLVDADIELGNLSVSPETKWDEDGEKETFLGNKYEREITLRFHDLDALRGFLADLPDSKNVRLDTLSFEYSKQGELKRRMRRDAIEDARRGAEDMAAAVGKRLLDLQNVSDRAQSTTYSASGYNSNALGTVTVMGGAYREPRRTSDIVLREGEITISADAFLVYVIGE